MNPSLYPTRAPRKCLSKYSRPKTQNTSPTYSHNPNSFKNSQVPQNLSSLQYSYSILVQDNDLVAKPQSPFDSSNSGRKSTIGSESDSKSWSQDLEVRDSPNPFFWGNSNEIFIEKGNSISINIEELKAFGSPQMRNLEASELDEISIIEEDEEFGEEIEIALTNDENLSEKGEVEAEESFKEEENEEEDYYGEVEENENVCQEIEQVIQSSVEEPFLLRGFSFLMGNNNKHMNEQDASLYNFNIQPNYGGRFYEDTIYSRKNEFEEEENENKGFNFEDSDIDINCDRVLKKIKTDWNCFK